MKGRSRWLPYPLIFRNLCLSLAIVAVTVVLVDEVHRSGTMQAAQLETLKRLFTYRVITSFKYYGFLE
ncbi:MAG: hypothetical protein LVS60_14170 [Nodosilinea sp. LVE1205-7]|jgi:uncharacterized membrane protein